MNFAPLILLGNVRAEHPDLFIPPNGLYALVQNGNGLATLHMPLTYKPCTQWDNVNDSNKGAALDGYQEV